MNRTRPRLLVAGFVMSVAAAVVGWMLYFRERQEVDALTSRVTTIEQEAAVLQQLQEDTKLSQARSDMRAIETAAKTYYLQLSEWPTGVEQLAKYLEKGPAGLIDPWGHFYVFRVEQYEDSNGLMRDRPVVYSQSMGREPGALWPAK